MEELQSTEILEREILEDARKKAMRVLKNAEDTIHLKTAEWDKKTAQTISELEKKYEEQKKTSAEKVMARLPIDKLRAKVEKIENLLKTAVESWYKSLSKERILELLSNELTNRLELCEGISETTKINVNYSGLDRKDAENVLKNAYKNISFEETPSANQYPSLTLETENIRIIVSIQKIIDYYLQEKRSELIEALAGAAFTEEE